MTEKPAMRAPVATDATFSPTGGPAPHPTRSDAPQARTEARCRTCGCATTCLHDAYHEALVATVIRELNKLGALRLPEETDRA